MNQVVSHNLDDTNTLPKFTIGQQAAGLLLAIGICFLPSLIGYFFRPGNWYAALVKPALNPPNWVFAPVWTILYLLMAISSWIVWRKSGAKSAKAALTLFGVQLLLNALWSWLFFGLQSIGAALVDIVLLWGAISLVIGRFIRHSRLAAWLLVPYFLWVSFAMYLNLAYWVLNR